MVMVFYNDLDMQSVYWYDDWSKTLRFIFSLKKCILKSAQNKDYTSNNNINNQTAE